MKHRYTRTVLIMIATLFASVSNAGARRQLVVWAWERPEDLRFLPADVEIAVQSGFVVIAGDHFSVRGRRFPLRARTGQVRTSVVHVQIEGREPLIWSSALSARVAASIVRLGGVIGIERLQIDFEVTQSNRRVLLDVLRDVRAALPPGVSFSMTALTSWCLGETWLDNAPVDEVVPMLFRMGRTGESITQRISEGQALQPVCRSAAAVATDTLAPRLLQVRRVYLFNPRSWTQADFAVARERVDAWDAR